jgi:dipeptidyl aminopeptidase/acylaminoacyl peptidase
MTSFSIRSAAVAVLCWCAGSKAVAGAVSLDAYARADAVRSFDSQAVGGRVFPHWLHDGARFYYTSKAAHDRPGTTLLVDPRDGSRRPLFDAARVGASLAGLTHTTIEADKLPAWSLTESEAALWFDLPSGAYLCELVTSNCHVASAAEQDAIRALAVPDWAVRSPDGRWDAFIWNQNVYVRPASRVRPQRGAYHLGDDRPSAGNSRFGGALSDSLDDFQPTGQRAGCDQGAPSGPVNIASPTPVSPPDGSIALTTDGTELWSYGRKWKGGAEVATLDVDRYKPTKGGMAWSPDSSKLVVRREDIRGVRIYPLYSSTGAQPVDHSYYYAAPGDAHVPQSDDYVIDVARRVVTHVDLPPTGLVLDPSGAEWAADSQRLFILTSGRGVKEVRLSVFDTRTGTLQTIARDASATFVETSNGDGESQDGAPQIAISGGGTDVIWFSERDGWGHLYRYGSDGTLKNQIEKGNYSVAEIVRVDSAARRLYFTAWGKEPGIPYYRHLYRVDFNGSHLVHLTPEAGNHLIQWFPNGEFFLDTYSSVETAPVVDLRRADGRLVMHLARGDDSELRKIGWRPAETFEVKARDGITDLYGVMYKPYDFDPNKRYPIVANVYPGPFTGSATWSFQGPDNYGAQIRDSPIEGVTHGEGMGQSLADLGFIVIKLDALGSARRSKAIQDFFYGHVLDNGLPDQIAAIEQLARRYPWIDAARAGIFGHSGGGYSATAGMLLHPDVFKVGVAEAGNNDFRTYGWYWGEKYQGLLKTPADEATYEAQASYRYAAHLKGKLLLIHGDMDCNNPMAQTLRVVDALIKAAKPFDMLIVPDSGHQLPPYVMKRAWDYFIENLLGDATLPDYELLKAGS